MQISRLRLFSSTALIGMIVNLLLMAVRLPIHHVLLDRDVLVRLIVAAILFTCYWISRYGYIRELSFAFAISISILLIANTALDPDPAFSSLDYLGAALIAVSLFLSVWSIAILLVGQVVGMLMLPLLTEISYEALIDDPISFNLTVGVIILIIMYHRDWLERIRQHQVHASEKHYRTLAESAPVTIIRIDPRARIQYINRDTTGDGIFTSDALGRSLCDFALPDDRPILEAAIARLFTEGINEQYEVRFVDGSGRVAYYKVNQAPVVSGNTVAEAIIITLNITSERQAYQAQTEGEVRYQSVITALSEGIVVQSRTGEIITYNESAEQILGVSASEIAERRLNDDLWQAIYEDGTPYRPEDHPSAVTLRTGQPVKRQIMGVRRSSGELVWISINSQPLRLEKEPEAYAVVISFNDVTEQRGYVQSLARSESLLRALLNAPTDSVTLLERDGTILAHNETVLKRMENPPPGVTSLVGLNVFDFMPAESAQAIMDAIGVVASSREAIRHQIHQADEWYDLVMFPITEPDGQINRVGVISRQITELKQLEFSLRQSKMQLETLFANSTNGIIFTDIPLPLYPEEIMAMSDDELESILRQQRVVQANEAMARMFGMQVKDLVGTYWHEVFQYDRAAALQASKALIMKGQLHVVTQQRRVDGTPVWTEADYTALYDIDGKMTGHLCIQRDITQRRQQEQQRFEQERARILSNFVQDALHEFRTPLSSILLSAHMIERVNTEENNQLRAERIREQVDRIQGLIEDLGQISELDHVKLELMTASTLNEIIHAVTSPRQDNLGERELTINLLLVQSASRLEISSHQIQLALTKLLDNAIRYTPDGGKITVRTYVEDAAFCIAVEDTGIGIDAEHLPHVFDRFYRVDTAHTTPGFGIGLTTVRLVAEQHNGQVDVISMPGQGSTFTLRLPMIAEPTPAS